VGQAHVSPLPESLPVTRFPSPSRWLRFAGTKPRSLPRQADVNTLNIGNGSKDAMLLHKVSNGRMHALELLTPKV